MPADLFNMHFKEVSLLCSFGRGDAMGRALEELAKLDLDGVITENYPLDRIADAFERAGSGHGIKTAVKPNE